MGVPDEGDKCGEEEATPDPYLYRFVKRVPQRPHTRKNDIYVSRSSSFVAMQKRALRLLHEGEVEVVIHALSAAMEKACDLARGLVEQSNGTIALAPSTSTVTLIDGYEPLKPGLEPITQVRYNS